MAGHSPQERAAQELDASKSTTAHSRSSSRATPRLPTLRSNTFPTPATGRLSVSLWLRVGDPASSRPCDWRSKAARTKGCIIVLPRSAASDRCRVVSTEWSQYIFQVDDLPAEGCRSCESASISGPGEVWIDDVELFDLAFSPNERVELTKIIGLADLKLKSGQLADCARLLDGYWPHFLVTNVPLTETSAAVGQGSGAAAAPVETARRPGMLDQMRGYLPKWWQ